MPRATDADEAAQVVAYLSVLETPTVGGCSGSRRTWSTCEDTQDPVRGLRAMCLREAAPADTRVMDKQKKQLVLASPDLFRAVQRHLSAGVDLAALNMEASDLASGVFEFVPEAHSAADD